MEREGGREEREVAQKLKKNKSGRQFSQGRDSGRRKLEKEGVWKMIYRKGICKKKKYRAESRSAERYRSEEKRSLNENRGRGAGEDDHGYFQVEEPGLPPVCEAIQSHF